MLTQLPSARERLALFLSFRMARPKPDPAFFCLPDERDIRPLNLSDPVHSKCRVSKIFYHVTHVVLGVLYLEIKLIYKPGDDANFFEVYCSCVESLEDSAALRIVQMCDVSPA